MSLSREKKRILAERLFINEGMTAKAIALELETTEASVCKWRKGKAGEKNWDERKTEILSAPHKIKEMLMKQLQLVADGKEPTIKTDALAKISKVLETISGKVPVQIVLTVLKEFDNWMVEQDPDEALRFTDWHKKFIHYKASIE